MNDIRLSIIFFFISANQLKSLHGRFVFHYNFPERISIGRSNFYLLRCPEKGEIVDEVRQHLKKQLSETRMPFLNLLDQCFATWAPPNI
jgi:hypothetical protein